MAEMPLTVRPDRGTPYEVTARGREILAWERGGPGRKYSNLLKAAAGSNQHAVAMEDLYALAWAAARRAGLFAGSLAEFEDSVEVESGHALTDPDGEAGGEDDSDRPTSPAP